MDRVDARRQSTRAHVSIRRTPLPCRDRVRLRPRDMVDRPRGAASLDSPGPLPSATQVMTRRRFGLLLALPALTIGLAYRFALVYRQRAGYPARRPATVSPSDLGLRFETVRIPAATGLLPGWFIPSPEGASAPAVILVHGWESNRGRVLPNARFLHDIGFHVLAFDVRGHGENPAEQLPISGAEFASDTGAAVAWLAARPDVARIGVLGHSMGAVGAILAAAENPAIEALVSTAAPADPARLTRQTFLLAGLPIPGFMGGPLAWLTARVYLRPRGHSVAGIDGRRAIARYPGPVLIMHGSSDQVIPLQFFRNLAEAARNGAPSRVETYVVPDGTHSFLYEDPGYRRVVGRFFAATLGGPVEPERAGERSARTSLERPEEPRQPLEALVRLGVESPTATGSSAPRSRNRRSSTRRGPRPIAR